MSFNRGWASIDGSLGAHRFHYASTHLETEDFPDVQEAQAAEFLAGPSHGPGADLATGDFNSAADGSTTTSYAQLTSQFKDAWRVNRGDPGLSCCQNETLSNPVSQLGSRIDLVLFRNGATPGPRRSSEPCRSRRLRRCGRPTTPGSSRRCGSAADRPRVQPRPAYSWGIHCRHSSTVPKPNRW